MIAIIVASNNKNLDLAYKIDDVVQQLGQKTEIIDLVAEDLPLYTPKAQELGIPKTVKKLSEKLINAEKMIFVAPEYNGGIPPTLTNLLAWVSVSGDDWRSCFNGKSAAIATYSGGGGQYVLMAMRSQLSYIGMNVVGRQILTNSKKEFTLDSAMEVIKQLIK